MSRDGIQARNNQGAQIMKSPYALDVGGELHVAADVTNAITAESQDSVGLLVISERDDAIRAVSGTNDKAAVDAFGGRGIGVRAFGETAPLQLSPSGADPGPPTSGDHEAGMLYLDFQADLYLCKASGNPGVWKFLG
ncbi:hypothetical protein ACGFYU_02590 [Streptomyces sp. NPDC048337]|uniref:hypothetical protein n=1 Tax=Streptomyces sp. NPDC048337 TaxID=3365535 RepID=UPI0037169E09